MKKNIYNILVFGVLVLAASLLASCSIHFNKRGGADGKQTTKTYDITQAFKGIDSKASVEIFYTVSDSVSVKAEGPEGYIEDLQITVGEDSILHIVKANDVDLNFDEDEEDDKDIIHLTPKESHDDVKIYISGPSISSLTAAGSVGFKTEDVLKTDTLAVNIAGAAEIDIKGIEANDFKIVSKGASKIDIKSLKAEAAYIETAGAGEVNSKLVDVKKTTFSGKGASDVELDFQNCDEANIHIAGAGEVTLSGTLHKLNKNVAGAGSIDDDNLTIK